MNDDKPVRQKHRHQREPIRTVPAWRKYGVELAGLVVVGVGLFLVLERMTLRETLSTWFRDTARSLMGRFQQAGSAFDAFLDQVSVSDVVGFTLIVGALAAILLRIRWRLLNNPKLTAVVCPKCGGVIHRAHRTKTDHVVAAFVPVRRYRCASISCGWRGLRVGEQHGSSHHHARPSNVGE